MIAYYYYLCLTFEISNSCKYLQINFMFLGNNSLKKLFLKLMELNKYSLYFIIQNQFNKKNIETFLNFKGVQRLLKNKKTRSKFGTSPKSCCTNFHFTYCITDPLMEYMSKKIHILNTPYLHLIEITYKKLI